MEIDEPLDELMSRVGDLRRLARAEVYEHTEGVGRGARVARMSMIGGLELEVFPDRGMDIGGALWQGIPLAWVSPAGPVAPALLDSGSLGWKRSFGGGLLVTCGLDQIGVESDDGGMTLPMHGRANRQPATGFHTWSRRQGDDWQIGSSGETRQSTAFDENLRLNRSLVTSLHDRSLRLHDEVTNDGHDRAPHMLLYHFNFGWPLIAADSLISVGYDLEGVRTMCTEPEPRDDEASRGLQTWDRIGGVSAEAREQVFVFEFPPGATVVVTIASPRAGLSATLRFEARELPVLYLWKLLRPGANVVGLEPANCRGIHGRAQARVDGELRFLDPGESRYYDLRLEVCRIG